MKVKTSELQGAALDWAVAKCEGKDGYCEIHAGNIWYGRVTSGFTRYHPSTNRDQGYEILEREKIGSLHEARGVWSAGTKWDDPTKVFYGKTKLIACLRAYVHSKLGEEVDIPIELTELGETV